MEEQFKCMNVTALVYQLNFESTAAILFGKQPPLHSSNYLPITHPPTYLWQLLILFCNSCKLKAKHSTSTANKHCVNFPSKQLLQVNYRITGNLRIDRKSIMLIILCSYIAKIMVQKTRTGKYSSFK